MVEGDIPCSISGRSHTNDSMVPAVSFTASITGSSITSYVSSTRNSRKRQSFNGTEISSCRERYFTDVCAVLCSSVSDSRYISVVGGGSDGMA